MELLVQKFPNRKGPVNRNGKEASVAGKIGKAGRYRTIKCLNFYPKLGEHKASSTVHSRLLVVTFFSIGNQKHFLYFIDWQD
jgi:hypothetical protein